LGTRAVSGIPDYFELLSRTWDVKWVPEGSLKDAEGNQCYGLTDFEAAVISIEEGHNARFCQTVFWHEVRHVLDQAMGIPPEEHSEKDCDLFGQLMAQMMRTMKP
jgi:hypothetical protein